jgi:hypothetical protein
MITRVLHEFYTNGGSNFAKKTQKSTLLIEDRFFSIFNLVIEIIGNFDSRSGDSGGARTPDLMLRRTHNSALILREYSAFYKITRMLHVN